MQEKKFSRLKISQSTFLHTITADRILTETENSVPNWGFSVCVLAHSPFDDAEKTSECWCSRHLNWESQSSSTSSSGKSKKPTTSSKISSDRPLKLLSKNQESFMLAISVPKHYTTQETANTHIVIPCLHTTKKTFQKKKKKRKKKQPKPPIIS